MREIKFRAWDKEDKTIYLHCEMGFNGLKFWELIESDRFILMEFTGLKDKNGKEIYEGDIIKCKKLWSGINRDEIGVVEWNNKRSSFQLKNIYSNKFIYAMMTSVNNKEVIGNIYENEELIK